MRAAVTAIVVGIAVAGSAIESFAYDPVPLDDAITTYTVDDTWACTKEADFDQYGMLVMNHHVGEASLKTLADQAGVTPSAYTQRVQRVIADLMPKLRSDHTNDNSGWLGTISDEVLTALLVYGYPALGLTLLFGAIGLPLPDGIATTIAGSLASQGRIDWFWAVTVAVTSSVLGDMVGYSLGRLLSQKFLERHGHWFGYTSARRAQAAT